MLVKSLFVATLTAPVVAQSLTGPTLVADLDTTPGAELESVPERVGENGFGTYFCADIDTNQRAVVYTDGTPGGTVPLAWETGSYSLDEATSFATLPSGRVVFGGDLEHSGNVLLFAVGPGVTAVERIDLDPGTNTNEGVQRLVEWSGEVWFWATTPAGGRELWHSDGTSAGTLPGPELVPGAGSGGVDDDLLVVAGGKLFFTATNPDGVWCLDSPTGTPQWLASPATSFWNTERKMAAVGNYCVFRLDSPAEGIELWSSDGTVAGTGLLADLNPGTAHTFAEFMAESAGLLYFEAKTPGFGNELWTTDGTTAGTSMVTDFWPGSTGGTGWRKGMAWNGGVLYFARCPTHGLEPAFSDGTAGGTYHIADIVPGTGSSLSGYGIAFADVGSRAVFRAATPAAGSELWSTDGTELGTEQIAEFVPGAEYNFIEFLGRTPLGVVFQADDDVHGREPWITDGTSGGTALLAQPYPSPVSVGSGPGSQYRFRDSLYFSADVPAYGRESWLTDGTAEGTTMIADWNPGPSDGDLGDPFGVVNDLLLLFGDAKLYATDGTVSGTVELGEYPVPAGHYTYVTASRPLDGRVLVEIEEEWDDGKNFYSERELWTSDGTPAGTGPLVPALWPSSSSGDLLARPILGGWLMNADLEVGIGAELYHTDGTAAGTQLLADIEPGPGSSSIRWLASTDDLAFFYPNTTAEGRELWTADGTAGGTALVKDIRPGPDSALGFSPSAVLLEDVLLFPADDGASGTELWRSDGTAAGTGLLFDVVPGGGSSFPHHFVAAGGLVYFEVTNDQGQTALWVTDGTPGRTLELLPQDTFKGVPAGDGGDYLFAAHDAELGLELWMSDGTPAGTELALDLHAGPASGTPTNLHRVGGRIVFEADDGVHGLELHSILLADLGAWASEPYGQGCDAELTASGLAVLGEALTLDLESHATAPGVTLVSLEPTWIDLGAGCSLYAWPPVLQLPVFTDSAGIGQLPLTLPTSPELAGVGVFFQTIVQGPAPGFALAFSNGLELQLAAP